MLTRFGHDQIDRELRLLRRLEAYERMDVETRFLRTAQVDEESVAVEAYRPPEVVRRGQRRLRAILGSLRRAQRAVGG